MGCAEVVSAFQTASAFGNPNQKTCAYTQLLQTSVSVRRMYLVKVAQATGSQGMDGNTVEDMYGNIQKASYSADASSDAAEDSLNIWGFDVQKTASVVGLDSMSLDCLGCHDGASASPIGADLRNDPFRSGTKFNRSSTDHPVGMDYDSYVSSGRGYKSVMSAGTKMIFVDGKVGCLTCHDPLNPEKGHLVMSDRNSQLCKTCHDK
jgi:predicted CXXCH cytochrome family protein